MIWMTNLLKLPYSDEQIYLDCRAQIKIEIFFK